jgi:hypothetical protein
MAWLGLGARSHFTCTRDPVEPSYLDWNSRVLAFIHRAILVLLLPHTQQHRVGGLLDPAAHPRSSSHGHVFLAGKTTMGGGAGEIAVGTSSSSSATNSNNIASPMMPVVTLSQVRGVVVGVKPQRARLMMLCGLARQARRTGGAAASIAGSRARPDGDMYIHAAFHATFRLYTCIYLFLPTPRIFVLVLLVPTLAPIPLPSRCSVRTQSILSFLPEHQHENVPSGTSGSSFLHIL